MTDDSVSTKVVAKDILTAFSIREETPINGHNPKNWTNTKLFTNAAEKIISRRSVKRMPFLV